MLFIVQLRLHRGRVDLNDLDVARSVLELLSQAEDEVVQRGFGGRVIWCSEQGCLGFHRLATPFIHLLDRQSIWTYQGETRCRVDERRLLALLLEVRQELDRQVQVGEVVRVQLVVQHILVDCLGFAKVEAPLDTRVQEDTVGSRQFYI